MTATIETGVVHEVPEDLAKALQADKNVLDIWNGLTPLARNEWICWVITPKKPETRERQVRRLGNDLLKGKRRPCCWPGCQHRK